MSCVEYLDGCFGCVRSEEPNFAEKRWTTVMGIGPAKSGSTSLSDELEKSGLVVVGDRDVDVPEKHHVSSELQWLAKDNSVRKGLKDLSKFFSPATENTVAYFEKDPQYETKHAAHAAYRARAFLGPNLKLVHTSRDFVDLDGSLYLYRKAFLNNVSYAEWVDFRIEAFNAREECREEEFSKLMVPSYNGEKTSIKDLHNPKAFSIESASLIETRLYKMCDTVERPSNGIQDFMHAIFMVTDLKRWMHAFGKKENFHCIDLASRARDPASVYYGLYKFLGVDDEEFLEERLVKLSKQAMSEDYDMGQHTIDRLVQAHVPFVDPRFNITQSVMDSRKRVSDLGKKQVTCEDLEWYEEICGYPAPGYMSCD